MEPKTRKLKVASKLFPKCEKFADGQPIPAGWLIYNAPRPLAADWGHSWEDWHNPCPWGRHFVALDPEGEFFSRMDDDNRRLDARIIVYLSDAEVEDLTDKAIESWASEAEGHRAGNGALIRTYYGENRSEATEQVLQDLFDQGR